MIRKNKQEHAPLYREVLQEAFVSAWQKRRFWLFALVAAILQTGGTLDIILYSVKQLTMQGGTVLHTPWISLLSSHTLLQGTHDLQQIFANIGRIQAFTYVSLIIGGILTCSILAQGALVYGLDPRRSGKPVRLWECLAMGGKHSWSIAALNIITIGLIWLSRFLLLVPLAISAEHPSVGSLVVYISTFLLFILVSFLFTTIHLFTLNSLVLEDLPLWLSIEQAYTLFKKSWLIILETGALMLGVGFLMMIAAFIIFLFSAVPLFLLMLGAVLLQSTSVLALVYAISSLLLVVIMVTCGTYMVTVQYDTWGRLYQRIRNGTALAKLHRWYRWIKHVDLRFHS